MGNLTVKGGVSFIINEKFLKNKNEITEMIEKISENHGMRICNMENVENKQFHYHISLNHGNLFYTYNMKENEFGKFFKCVDRTINSDLTYCYAIFENGNFNQYFIE